MFNKTDTGYLETFGLMCTECDFYKIKVKTGVVGKLNILMDEAQRFEEFHKIEASKLPENQDYWAEEINGSWYEAIDNWLNELYKYKESRYEEINRRKD